MQLFSISELKRAASGGRIEGAVHAQVEVISKKETREQKPYWELVMADAGAKLTLRAWSDSPNFSLCEELAKGALLEITGEFALNPPYGLDAKRWACRALTGEERDTLLKGPASLREKQDADYEFLRQTASTIGDPRLRALCEVFFAEFGERFQRTAAARNYHHSRRGGLVEHTAQMMRAAGAIASVYPRLNRDLLLAGVLFHDVGKLWENAFPENGFAMPYDERGELIGHITIGVELVNTLWRKTQASAPDASDWPGLHPPSDDVRLHLLHLIAAHHGAKEFGSPVDPKTPEAFALNHIDNLDAKLEMIFSGYETAARLGARVFERARPLPANLVEPLPPFLKGSEEAHEEKPEDLSETE
jgi:3'-5' exoribonuclease